MGITTTAVIFGPEACARLVLGLCKETPALSSLWALAVGLAALLGYCPWECAAGCVFPNVKKSSWKGN